MATAQPVDRPKVQAFLFFAASSSYFLGAFLDSLGMSLRAQLDYFLWVFLIQIL